MKVIKYITVLIASIFIFNSCTKQVTGPAGPNGLTGPQGPAASYSVTIDSVSPAAWVANANGYGYTFTNVNSLTLPNYDIVEVYYSTSFNKNSIWGELPMTDALTAAGGDIFQFSAYLYTVTVDYIYTAPPLQEIYFKIVVINQP